MPGNSVRSGCTVIHTSFTKNGLLSLWLDSKTYIFGKQINNKIFSPFLQLNNYDLLLSENGRRSVASACSRRTQSRVSSAMTSDSGGQPRRFTEREMSRLIRRLQVRLSLNYRTDASWLATWFSRCLQNKYWGNNKNSLSHSLTLI